MSATITENVTLETTTCWKCGITHAVPQHFLAMRREDSQSFYCPNGHSGAFVKSTADILRSKLEAKEKELSAAKTREQSEREQKWAAEAERDKVKRAAARLKKRVASGVCPCCNRSFENLQRHMHTKHPDFTEKK